MPIRTAGAGPGLQGLARPLVELVGGEPASLAVLA